LWPLLDADLHDVYGIDTATGILRKRTATWFRHRVFGLLTADTRISRALRPPDEPAPTPSEE